jgi:hypothetical protein
VLELLTELLQQLVSMLHLQFLLALLRNQLELKW